MDTAMSPIMVNVLEYVHMRCRMNWNWYEISFWLKITPWCSFSFLCSHDLRQIETQTGMDLIWIILIEMNFQTGSKFSCEQNLPRVKWINTDLLNVAFNVHVSLKLIAALFHCIHFYRNEISFLMIKYVNTTQNEMYLHVYQNIGLF